MPDVSWIPWRQRGFASILKDIPWIGSPTGQANLTIEEYAGFHQAKGGKAFQAEATARTRIWTLEELQSSGKGGVRSGWRDICFEGLGFAR